MTAPHETQMIRDAGRKPALWRLLLGFVTAFVVLAAWLAAIIAIRAAADGTPFIDAGADILALGAQTPSQTALYLTTVAGLGLGAFAAARIWHARSPRSVIGPGPRTLRHGVLAAATAFSVLGLLGILTLPFSDLPERNLDVGTWLAWLPVGILALVLQTGGEEIFFRGYLQSQLAARFRAPIVAIGLPSILFGFAHYIPTLPITAALTYVLIATMFGVLAADLTARTGSLGAAWGFHFANNALAVLFIAPGGSLTGLALWRTGSGLDAEALMTPLVSLEILILLATWALIRRVLRV